MPTRTFELIYPRKVDSKREITAKMIDEIIANSSDKSRFPVAIGHDAAMGFGSKGDAEKAAGRFGSFRKDDTETLLANVQLRAQVEEEYADGAYPGWSVGIYNDKDQGWHMDHLALLGSVGAAFKDLQERTNDMFSIVDQSDQSMEIECFNSDGTHNKTLWLLQCVPKQPATVETPAASFSTPPNGGNDEMDAKEFEAYKAQQEEAMTQLKADNDKLKADNEMRLKAEIDRRATEFSGLKETLLKAAADKGVNEPARNALSEALNAYDAHYAGGVVSRELFDSLTKVFEQLKPKLEPGELHEDDEPDEFVLKQKWSKGEDIDALTN